MPMPACLVAFVLALPQSAPRSAAPGADAPRALFEALPGDAPFRAAIEDFSGLWIRAQRSVWAALLSDPLLEPVRRRCDAFLQGRTEDDELTWNQALEALEGVAGFAGSIEHGDRQPRGLVLRLRPGSELAATLRATLEHQGEAVELDGRRFLAARGGDTGTWQVGFAWSRGVAVIEVREPQRESALRVAAELARALEGAPDSTAGPDLRADPASLQVVLDVGALLRSETEPGSARDRRAHEVFDLAGFGPGGLRLAFDDDGQLQVDAHLELPHGGVWPGWLAAVRPTPTRFVPLAPAGTIEVCALGYDFGAAWSGTREWLATALPEDAQTLTQGLEQLRAATGIDLERQLLHPLAGDFTSFLLPLEDDESGSLNGAMISLLLGLLDTSGDAAGRVHVIGLDEVAPVAELVETLVARAAASGTARPVLEVEVAGRALRFFDLPEVGLQPSWAFLDQGLVFALHRSGVRAILEQAAHEPPTSSAALDPPCGRLPDDPGLRASSADLQGLVQSAIVAPFTRLAERARGGDDGDPPIEFLERVVPLLPGLVERHLRGRVRTTLALDDGRLCYRLWTE